MGKATAVTTNATPRTINGSPAPVELTFSPRKPIFPPGRSGNSSKTTAPNTTSTTPSRASAAIIAVDYLDGSIRLGSARSARRSAQSAGLTPETVRLALCARKRVDSAPDDVVAVTAEEHHGYRAERRVGHRQARRRPTTRSAGRTVTGNGRCACHDCSPEGHPTSTYRPSTRSNACNEGVSGSGSTSQ